MQTKTPEHYRAQFKAELCNLIGCDENSLPATANKDIAADYLGLKNKKTLNVWHSTGRHGIVMVKVGRNTEPSTDWLIDLKMAGLSIAAEVA